MRDRQGGLSGTGVNARSRSSPRRPPMDWKTNVGDDRFWRPVTMTRSLRTVISRSVSSRSWRTVIWPVSTGPKTRNRSPSGAGRRAAHSRRRFQACVPGQIDAGREDLGAYRRVGGHAGADGDRRGVLLPPGRRPGPHRVPSMGMGASSEANTASGTVGVQTPPSGPLHRTHVLTQPGTVAAHAGQRPGGAMAISPIATGPRSAPKMNRIPG